MIPQVHSAQYKYYIQRKWHKLFLAMQKECIDDILLCNQKERNLIYLN